MPAKIDGYSTAEPLVPLKGSTNSGADKLQGDAAGTVPSNAQTGDQVTLTASARSLQKIFEAVDQAPVVDSAKVAAIKQSLSGGTYKINARSVAGKLLQLDGELK